MKYCWNGVEFLELPDEEAERLEREDKVQILTSERPLGGNDLKFRSQFKGYQVRAETAEQPKKRGRGRPRKYETREMRAK